jgi:WD40 repeat protein
MPNEAGQLVTRDGVHTAPHARARPTRSWSSTLQTIATAGALRAVAFNPDGARLATAGSDGVARVWDARTGRELLTLPGHVGALVDVVFTPEGDRLLTSGRDGPTRLGT